MYGMRLGCSSCLGGGVNAVGVPVTGEGGGAHDRGAAGAGEDVGRPVVAASLELRVPPSRVVLHEEELDPDLFERERALPRKALRLDPVEVEVVDDAPVLGGIEQ